MDHVGGKTITADDKTSVALVRVTGWISRDNVRWKVDWISRWPEDKKEDLRAKESVML